MDFTLIERIEIYGMRYKLLRSNFCRGYYVIIIQSKNEFSCQSFSSTKEAALDLYYEIAASATDPNSLRDIISDYERQNILSHK
jgi:hypothetical protein